MPRPNNVRPIAESDATSLTRLLRAGQAPQPEQQPHDTMTRTMRSIAADGTPGTPSSGNRTALLADPRLAKLERLRTQATLRRDQQVAVNHILQAARLRDDVFTNGELLHLRGEVTSPVATSALRRSASFARCQPILDDLNRLLQKFSSVGTVSETDRTLVEAGLEEVRRTSEAVQAHAIEQARSGARIAPLTTTQHRFRWFLDRHQRLLSGIVSACSLSGEARRHALQDGLTQLAHAYCNAADIPAPIDNLKVNLTQDGRDHVIVSRPHSNGARDLSIALTTEGVDHPGVDPLPGLQRRGLASLLSGFERKSTPTRQAASYLQCFFHEITAFEELAKTIPHTLGPTPPLSRQASRSHDELTYRGDSVLGDTPAQRFAALSSVRALAAALAASNPAPAVAALIQDAQLRAWLLGPQCARDLEALSSPSVRMPIAQEPIARSASAPCLMFHT